MQEKDESQRSKMLEKYVNRAADHLGKVHINLGKLRTEHVESSKPLFHGLESVEQAIFSVIEELGNALTGNVTVFIRQQSSNAIAQMLADVDSAASVALQSKMTRSPIRGADGTGWDKKQLANGKWRTECNASHCETCGGRCTYVSEEASLPVGVFACEHGCARVRKGGK